MFYPVFVEYFVSSLVFNNHPAGGDRACCLTLIFFLMLCYCCCSWHFPHDAVCWYVVCHCVISWSNSLALLIYNALNKHYRILNKLKSKNLVQRYGR